MAGLLIALVIALPLHGIWALSGRTATWPPRFLGLVARIVGAQTQVVGTPLRRDVVLVANHLSWIDILLLAGATGSVFVAKDTLERVPLIGWLCGLNRTIFVSREDRLGVAAQIDRIRAAIATHRPVTIFAEGTTGDGVTLLPFKAALLAALDPAPAGVRVQPVRIDYGDATPDLAWIGDESGQSHAIRVLKRRGTFVARLAFAEPFLPTGNRKAITAEARMRIEGIGNGC